MDVAVGAAPVAEVIGAEAPTAEVTGTEVTGAEVTGAEVTAAEAPGAEVHLLCLFILVSLALLTKNKNQKAQAASAFGCFPICECCS